MTVYAQHGAEDYNSKTALGCEAVGEPVFLLRAQDLYAPSVVRTWASMVRDPSMAEQADAIAEAMEEWQMEHGSKEPD